MSNTISISDWLKYVDAEYLTTFIRDGGSSVKFAVTPDGLKAGLYEAIEARCRELDYALVRLDAAISRAHMPQDIFFSLAAQIDWRLLARRLVLRLAEERGYRTEGIDPGAPGSVFEAIAGANGLEERSILFEMRPAIQNEALNNPNMARDFRRCMFHLCLMTAEPATSAQRSNPPLLDWLTGANTRISNVRMFGIHTAINRTTARYFIESALYWVRHAGYSGTVALLDNTRVTLARNPRDGQRYYTRAMTMEHYELLREFVDGVDRLSGTLLIVVTNYDFIGQTALRGWGIYQALQTRVMDDVRDRNLVNPVASLVRLSAD